MWFIIVRALIIFIPTLVDFSGFEFIKTSNMAIPRGLTPLNQREESGTPKNNWRFTWIYYPSTAHLQVNHHGNGSIL